MLWLSHSACSRMLPVRWEAHTCTLLLCGDFLLRFRNDCHAPDTLLSAASLQEVMVKSSAGEFAHEMNKVTGRAVQGGLH